MARIFLSHSNEDSVEAIAIRDWLVGQGWDDIFLDLDPERGIKAGQRWQAALKRAAERCELVIFLVSPAWVASKWCLAEFLLAKNLNKRIFGVIIAPTPLAELPTEMSAEWQVVDLTAGMRDYRASVATSPGGETHAVAFSNDGLNRLRIGLAQAGLDPRYFAWPPDDDPNRPPYRGLKPLEAEDAGIFFGRDGPIVLGLDLLRGLRDSPPPRLLVLLGASGAGKSSFMRAGLCPRLERDTKHFVLLPTLRPERAAISGEHGLVSVLEKALKAAGAGRSRADIQACVDQGVQGLTPLLSAILDRKTQTLLPQEPLTGETAASKPPTLVLPIDQVEELFRSEGAAQAHTFLQLLRELALLEAPAFIALFCIRSDNYERLQAAKELDGLRQHTLSLPPMPRGAYADVIKGPARRLEGTDRALEVEDTLVDAILDDIETGGAKDALPLLAFTLERLYREHGGDGNLRLSEYEDLGRVGGSIEAAVEQAFATADGDPKIPRDREARLTLLRRGLIPWLAGIDPDSGAPRRRVARLSEIPAEARPLIDHLVDQRLLSTDVSKDTGETTIEPAHEALLRQWGLLQSWLTEDAALLAVLDGIKRAARDWAANDKSPLWLVHVGERLRTAEALRARPDLAANLEPTDDAYLAECRSAEHAAKMRGRRRVALVSALVLLLAGSAGWWWKQNEIRSYYHWHVVMKPTPLSPEAEREKAAHPGSEFSDCRNGCPTMVVLPAGRFMMGSPVSVREAREQPQHEVSIVRPFAVGKYEITFEQWDACAASGACSRNISAAGWGRGRQPAINVSWDDAKRYVTWLSAKTGKSYTLLSEAQWEYAARAGEPGHFSFGNDDETHLRRFAWLADNAERRAHAVGTRAPNAWKLHDLHGNVWEWVEDCWRGTYKDAPTDGSVWDSPACIRRVVRGGSWLYGPKLLRSAARDWREFDKRDNTIGFRVARSLDQ